MDASLFWAKDYDIELEKTTKQFGTNSSYVLTHLLVVREGLGVLLVFANVSSGFLNIISNICHGLFDKRKFFLRHPVYIVVEVTMNSSQRPELPKNVNIRNQL